jgi:hypothetical protein
MSVSNAVNDRHEPMRDLSSMLASQLRTLHPHLGGERAAWYPALFARIPESLYAIVFLGQSNSTVT